MPSYRVVLLIVCSILCCCLACENEYDTGTKNPFQHPHDYTAPGKHEEVHHKNKEELELKQLESEIKEQQEGVVPEEQNRNTWQKPQVLLYKLGNLTDKVVVDIGAGSGYFSYVMAKVTNAKKVLATDIDPEAIKVINQRKEQYLSTGSNKELLKLETRIVEPDDPKLSTGEADVVVVINVYTYISNRVEYLKKLKEGVSSGGTIMIVDFKKRKLPEIIAGYDTTPKDDRIPLYQIEEDLEAAGFILKESDDTSLKYQYIVLATKG